MPIYAQPARPAVFSAKKTPDSQGRPHAKTVPRTPGAETATGERLFRTGRYLCRFDHSQGELVHILGVAVVAQRHGRVGADDLVVVPVAQQQQQQPNVEDG